MGQLHITVTPAHTGLSATPPGLHYRLAARTWHQEVSTTSGFRLCHHGLGNDKYQASENPVQARGRLNAPTQVSRLLSECRVGCLPAWGTSLPIVPKPQVGVSNRIVHAAADQLSRLVHRHPGHLVRVPLPGEGIVLACLSIPVMWEG